MEAPKPSLPSFSPPAPPTSPSGQCVVRTTTFPIAVPDLAWPTAVVGLPGGGIASGFSDGTISVWRASDGVLEAVLEGERQATPDQAVLALACGSSGDIVAGYRECVVRVWRDYVCAATLYGHTRSVMAVAVSNSGGTIVSGSLEHTARVWRASSVECAATLVGHQGVVSAVCVLSKGAIVTGSYDQTVRVWKRGRLRGPSTCTAVYKLPFAVTSLAALPDSGFAAGGRTPPGMYADGMYADDVGILSVWRRGEQVWTVEIGQRIVQVAAVGDFVVACTSAAVVVFREGVEVEQWAAHLPFAAPMGNNKLAFVHEENDDWVCSVFRVLRHSRLAVLHAMITAWELHGGVPPPHPDPPSRAALLARTLSLRRLCRPRGETDVGRAWEVVEPFAQAIAGFT